MPKSPAIEAVLEQRRTGYGTDTWLNLDLKPLTKVWQGIGGYSDFFFSEEDAREVRGSYMGTDPYRFAETLWRLCQVLPNKVKGYRVGIREFVVDLRTRAAISICDASPGLGSGSVFQYYIPDWQKTLQPTGRTFTFGAKNYPGL